MNDPRKTGTWGFLSTHSPRWPFPDFNCTALSFRRGSLRLKPGRVESPALSSHAALLDLRPQVLDSMRRTSPTTPQSYGKPPSSELGAWRFSKLLGFQSLYPASHSHSDLEQILFTSLRLSFHIWKAEIIATCLLGATGKA